MEIVILLLALLAVCGLRRRHSALRENAGERAVRRMLMNAFASRDYHLLNDVTLPVAGGTTQVDHILVSRYGIFVLETKHYSGWIFGQASAATWTQVLFRHKSRFQNPLHQNHKHAEAVAEILDFIPREDIRSIVVFTGDAAFKTRQPVQVLFLDELPAYLSRWTETVMSENRMQFCVGRLECLRLAISRETDIAHAAYLRGKFGDGA